jgi:hypothetical protein
MLVSLTYNYNMSRNQYVIFMSEQGHVAQEKVVFQPVCIQHLHCSCTTSYCTYASSQCCIVKYYITCETIGQKIIMMRDCMQMNQSNGMESISESQ